jgi:hypothetical protein
MNDSSSKICFTKNEIKVKGGVNEMTHRILFYLLNSAICFCENKTNTLDGAFFARLDPDPRVEPLCESAGVAAEAGVSAAVSAADSAADPSSFAFFFLTFFSLSA